MRVLVTGGAGFIGSHVVEACLENGHELMVVDNLSHGYRENVPAESRFALLDIGDPHLSTTFAFFRPEAVVHLAAQINASASVQAPIEDANANILGIINVLEACRQTRVRRFIHASSAAVYGTPLYLPVNELHPIAPLSPYGVSKYTGELYAAAYSHLHGLETVALRFANVYGPRQTVAAEGGVVALFVSQLSEDTQPTIYGDGEQSRDFVYVKDVADAVLSALGCTAGVTMNISTGVPTSVNTLLQIIREQMGCVVEPHHVASRAGDIRHSCLNNQMAQTHLDWSPQYSLEKGVAEAIGWINTHPALPGDATTASSQ